MPTTRFITDSSESRRAARNLAATLARLERRLSGLERSAQLGHSSIEARALSIFDDSGSLRGVVGVQDDGTVGAVAFNGSAPPIPTTPVVTGIVGGVSATWDGLFTGGEVAPLDFSRVEVHASTASGFTPSAATLMNTIESPQGGTVTIPLALGTWFVRLVTRNTSGTASAASVQDSGDPLSVLTDTSLEEIQATADGKNTIYYQAAEPTPPTGGFKTNDLWFDTDDGFKPSRWDGGAWEEVPFGSSAIATVDVGSLTAGVLTANITVSGTIATALAGARVELDADGIRAYEGDGVTVGFQVDSTSGKAEIIGGSIATAPAGTARVLISDADEAQIQFGSGAATEGTLGKIGTFYQQGIGTGGIDTPEPRIVAFTLEGPEVNGVPLGSLSFKYEATLGAVSSGSPVVTEINYFDLTANDISLNGPVAINVTKDVNRNQIGGRGGEEAPGLRIGELTGTHLRMDGNEIQAMNSNTDLDSGTLILNQNGGAVVIGTGTNALRYDPASSTRPMWRGPTGGSVDTAIKLGDNVVQCRNPNDASYRDIAASGFNVNSAVETKDDIRPVPFSALDAVLGAPARQWRYRPEFGDDSRTRIGPMADALPADLVHEDEFGTPSIDVGSMMGTLWAAVAELAARVDQIGQAPVTPRTGR